MKRMECPREAEVLTAVAASRDGGGLDDELRAHARTCGACADIVSLAILLRQDRDAMLREVRVPAAGQVWWRAALRAHAEGTLAARRPILWLQGLAAACLLGVAAALGGTAWTAMRNGVSWLSARGPRIELSSAEVARVTETIQPLLPLALVIGACLLITPIVVYFALADD